MSAPRVAGHLQPAVAFLNALGFERAIATGVAAEQSAVLAAFVASETFRWLRRWAVLAVVAVVTPISVFTAFADEMPEFHHVAVPLAVAVIVPAWVLELWGVRWPRLVLVAATVLPNVWLTVIGHNSTNYLWLPLLVAWVGFAGTRADGIVALVGATTTIALSVALFPGAGWSYVLGWLVVFLFAWFMALVLRRQVIVVAELGLLRGQAEERAREVAVLEERQRLSRELHDSVTQALYGISLYAQAADRALADGDTGPVAEGLGEIRDTARNALGEMRRLVFDLRVPVLEEQGLAAALRARLQAVERRSGMATELDCRGEDRLPSEVEQALYRVAQEALNNVLKHAQADLVTVRLAIAGDRASLEVDDDGAGFEPTSRDPHGLGLRGMRERVEQLGGTLRVDSAPGAGTRVRVEVPR